MATHRLIESMHCTTQMLCLSHLMIDVLHKHELLTFANTSSQLCVTYSIFIEQYLSYELMRDSRDFGLIICNRFSVAMDVSQIEFHAVMVDVVVPFLMYQFGFQFEIVMIVDHQVDSFDCLTYMISTMRL